MLEDLQRCDAATRLLLVQYGDYWEGARRLHEGEGETYAAQRYTVDFVAELAKRLQRVTVLTFAKDYPLRTLPSGVRCLGVELYPEGRRARHRELIQACAREQATHIVVSAPLAPLLAWSALTRARVLPLFADSFRASGLKQQAKSRLLAWLLNRSKFEWISNHNLAASLDLQRVGVDADKIVPFDWPAEVTPAERPAKSAPATDPFRLIYVGMLSEWKGTGDAVRALRILREQGRHVQLSLVGKGGDEFRRLAEELGLGSQVRFLGPQPHDKIVALMNEHDAVVVPSRHEYPEGLPMTIYEGLCSRSPLVVSDHPMFRLRIRDAENAVVFQAGSPVSLAGAVVRLMDDAALYAELSRAAGPAAENYLCPLKWHQLLATWLSNDAGVRRELGRFALSSGRYGVELSGA